MKKLSPEVQQTLQQILKLATYRAEYHRKKGLPLSFTHTCHKIGISPGTVRWYAPELYDNWENLDFHWELPSQLGTGKPVPGRIGNKGRYPRLAAMQRLHALAAYRERHMKKRGKPPGWSAACELVGIHYHTVVRHAPELVANWYDRDYHY